MSREQQQYDPRHREVLDVLTRAVRAQVDDLAHELVTEILAAVPAYRDHDVSREDLWRSCRTNLTRHLHLLAASQSTPVISTEALNPAAESTGARRATQEVPLEALLHAYRIGGRLIWERLLAAARQSGPECVDALLECTSFVWEINEANAAAAVTGFARSRGLTAEERRTQQEAALRSVLDGETPAGQSGLAAQIGLPTASWYGVVTTEDARSDLAALLGIALRQDLDIESVWLSHSSRHHAVVALRSRSVERLVEWLQVNINGRSGVSLPFADLLDAAGARTQADTALATVTPGTVGAACLDDCLPTAMVVRSPDLASRLWKAMLQPLSLLPDDERAILVHTLRTFLETGSSAGQTADMLYCHRNTVQNRMRRIEEVTGHRLSDPGTVVGFWLALEAERLGAGVAGAGGDVPRQPGRSALPPISQLDPARPSSMR